MDASRIYQAIEEEVIQDLIGETTLHYARTVDHAGEPDRHRFVVSGLGYDDDLLPTLADLQDRFDPDDVRLDASTRGTFVAFDFKPERIENAPPESGREYGGVTPHDARTREVSECANCHARCPNAYPKLVIQHRPNNPHSNGERETHDLCVDCAPGHYDDVVRKVEAFGVHDGEVDALQFKEDVSDDDTYRSEMELVWYGIEEVENPYIDDVVRIIERELL